MPAPKIWKQSFWNGMAVIINIPFKGKIFTSMIYLSLNIRIHQYSLLFFYLLVHLTLLLVFIYHFYFILFHTYFQIQDQEYYTFLEQMCSLLNFYCLLLFYFTQIFWMNYKLCSRNQNSYFIHLQQLFLIFSYL